MEKENYIATFESVLEKLVNEDYKEEIQSEFPKKSDFDNNYEDNFSIFEYFPRNSSLYCEILSTLTVISKCDPPAVLAYLSKNISTLISQKKLNNFFVEKIKSSGSQRLLSKEHFLLLLLFTDLILSIIKAYGVPNDPTCLIKTGLDLAFSYKEICISILLEQWSVIFLIISKEYPTQIFNIIKAKEKDRKMKRIRFFFTLIRYFRLDSSKFDGTKFIEFLSQYMPILEKFPREKSSVFTSLSSLLITYKGDIANLEVFYEAANKSCQNPSIFCPGALDLVTTLMVMMNKCDIKKVKDFCVTNIFSKANVQGMMPTAARVFRNYIWNFSLDPEWMQTGWDPEINDADKFYFHLKKLNKNDTTLLSLFEKYFLNSSQFNDCQSLLSDIIVLLAYIDFKCIRRWFKSLCENFGFSDVRIMTMIQTLPKINNPEFSSDNEAKKNDIEYFIEEFASRFFLEVYQNLNSDYDINSHIRKKYESIIDKSTRDIENLNANNHFDFGSSYEEISIFSRKSIHKELPYNELMEIMPSIVKGGLSGMKSLTESFIILSASRINKISLPMYQSCILLLKNPKSSYELIKKMNKMVKSPRHDAIICNCLKLLKKALDEPLDEILPSHEQNKYYIKEKLFQSIEFSAFIGLTSENPFVRVIAFKLLIKVNRFLSNEGLYSLIDEHWDSIQLDVRNLIFTQEYLKTPKKGKLHEEMFTIETCLRSKYLVPWLYFLAEFCRLIMQSNTSEMNNLYRKIASLASKLNKKNGLKDSNISKSLHQGLFVVFATTAYNIRKMNQPTYAFLNQITDEEKEKYYNDVIKILKAYCESESHNIFYVFRHLNYTIIPDLLYKIIAMGEKSSNSSDGKSIQVIRTFHTMIRTLDETVSITGDIFNNIKDYLIKMNKGLIKMTNDWESDIQNYMTKKEREKKGIQQLYKGNMKLYKIVLRSFLLIIQILLSKESIDLFYDHFGNSVYSIINLIVLLLEKSKNHKVFKFIKKLSSDILIDILTAKSLPPEYLAKFKKENDYLYFLETIAKCELYKKKVLKVLLKQNLSFLYYYIIAYFRAPVENYPLYFSAIYEIIVKNYEVKSQDDIDLKDPLYAKVLNLEQNKMWGYLFLLALFRMKTGGKRAEAFLKRLNLVYQKVVWSPKHNLEEYERDCDKNPAKVPVQYYGKRIAESVVAAALKELMSDNYSRSLKVMVDVLLRFIKLFQFYPNFNTCIPSQSEKKGDRLSKKEFLDNLMEITFMRAKAVNSFDKVLKLWMTLIERKSHRSLVFWYVFNYENKNSDYTHNKVVFINALMKKYSYNIIKRLSQRCKFSYYAFCTYQRKRDFDDEFWIVDVLTEAIEMLFDPQNKKLLVDVYNFMPFFIHYALLFHSNQTTKLLIKLCSKFEIPYSKMALSSDTLQTMVNSFLKRSMIDPLKEVWKKEAMRWVVGCNKLKYAHASLIILNELEKEAVFECESPVRSISSNNLTIRANINEIRSSGDNKIIGKDKEKEKSVSSSSNDVEIDWNAKENNIVFEDDDDNKTVKNGIFYDSLSDIEDSEDESENEIENNDENAKNENENDVIDLLKGVMKSTAHFIDKEFDKDRNEVYEFIDDTFQLFSGYFKRFEQVPQLCINYLNAFLDNDVPIDNYFPEMNALFESCFNFDQTGKFAHDILPNFFRPLLHVIESDSDAKKSFDRLVHDIAKKGQSSIDIELVRAALNRDEAYSIDNDSKIIFGSNLSDLNRVLGHYASMIDNASPDLKKRIFILSTLIIEKFQKFKESRKSKKLEGESSSASSIYTTQKTDITKSHVSQTPSNEQSNQSQSQNNEQSNQSQSQNNEQSNQSNNNVKSNKSKTRIKFETDSGKNIVKSPGIKIMSSEFSDPNKSEINTQYVVQIFNAAVRSLSDNKEAMNFIMKINQFNPLISTISFNDVSNINISKQVIVEALQRFSKQDNDVVTLTDCKKISSASNLIDPLTMPPSILPFTSEMSMLDNPEKSFKSLFDKWGLILKCIAGQILKKSIEKKDDEIVFTKLDPPVSFISDDKMKKPKQEPLLTISQFLQL